MADDIVTRLRNALDDYTVERDSAPLYLWAEAADEIERLQSEIAYLKQGWYPTPATVQSYPWWRKEWS